MQKKKMKLIDCNQSKNLIEQSSSHCSPDRCPMDSCKNLKSPPHSSKISIPAGNKWRNSELHPAHPCKPVPRFKVISSVKGGLRRNKGETLQLPHSGAPQPQSRDSVQDQKSLSTKFLSSAFSFTFVSLIFFFLYPIINFSDWIP